jgi:hypothetical protein
MGEAAMPLTLQKRAAKRSGVNLMGSIVSADGTIEVRIWDVSPLGALVELPDPPSPEDIVYLRCEDTSAEARVAWTDEKWCGLHFTAPVLAGPLIDSAGSGLSVSAPKKRRVVEPHTPDEEFESSRTIRFAREPQSL